MKPAAPLVTLSQVKDFIEYRGTSAEVGQAILEIAGGPSTEANRLYDSPSDHEKRRVVDRARQIAGDDRALVWNQWVWA